MIQIKMNIGIESTLYLHAWIKSKCIIELNARVNPQLGHAIFIKYLKGHLKVFLIINIK